jgi:hypothetical protein
VDDVQPELVILKVEIFRLAFTGSEKRCRLM